MRGSVQAKNKTLNKCDKDTSVKDKGPFNVETENQLIGRIRCITGRDRPYLSTLFPFFRSLDPS
jgi:hypothetical protein